MQVSVSAIIGDDEMLGDLLENILKLDAPPQTREDEFISYYTSGSAPRMTALLLWLKGQFDLYDRFAHYDMFMHDTRAIAPRRSQLIKVARVMIEHYLMQAHGSWFMANASHKEPCDMGQVLDKLTALSAISSIIFGENRS